MSKGRCSQTKLSQTRDPGQRTKRCSFDQAAGCYSALHEKQVTY
jgi:hypothetical protein